MAYADLSALNKKYEKNENYSALPFQETNPEKKNEKWAQTICEYSYNSWIKGTTAIPYSRRADFWTYRLYSDDRQPTAKYLERMSVKNQKSGKRKAYANFSQDNIAVLSKFKRIYLSMMNEMEHDLAVFCTDSVSVSEREEKKWRTWSKMLLQTMGIEYSQDNELPIKPRNIQELEMLYSAPFNLIKETAYQRIFEDSFYISNWDEIRDEVHEDFFDLGIAGIKDYVQDGKIKGRYCDPMNTIILETNRKTFELSPLIAEVVPRKISEVRPMIQKALRKQGLSDDEIEAKIRTIAQSYQNIVGNPVYSYGDTWYGFFSQYGFYPYDQFIIYVMDAEWDSVDEWDGTCVNVKYVNQWVVGTDINMEFGYANDIPREASSAKKYKDVARGSYHFYKVSDKSIVATTIEAVDRINLAKRRIDNEIAKGKGAGVIVDTSVIRNVDLGNGTLQPIEVMRIYADTGTLYYSSTTHHSQVISPTAARPITPDEGGIGRFLQECIQIIDFSLNIIRGAIGINEVTDSSLQDPKVLVGVAEHLAQATNRALQPLYKGYVDIKTNFAKNILLRVQARNKFGGNDYYKDVLGDAMYAAIANDDVSTFRFLVIPRITEQDKREIKEAALKAVTVPLEQGGITYSTYFQILDFINRGNFFGINMAQLILSHETEASIQRATQEKQALIEQQGEKNIQMQQAVTEGKQQEVQVTFSGELELQNNQGKITKEVNRELHEQKMQQLGLEQQMIKEGKIYQADRQREGVAEKNQVELIKAKEKKKEPA